MPTLYLSLGRDTADMKFGIMHSHINDPTEAVDMAVRAEAAGFDSFWTTDFALGDSPDPLPLLAAASQRTQRILLGTAVMVLPYRHPLLLAKAAATVDALTNGRLILGLGVGSNKREFDALGLDIHERGKMADEKLMLLRKLLSGEKVSHKGKYHQFDGVDVGPETAQKPHPPIWTGPLWKNGLVESTIVRAGRMADGFVPTLVPASEYKSVREKVRVYARGARRDPDAIEFGTVLWFCLDDDREKAWETLEAESNRRRSHTKAVRGEANVSGRAEDCAEGIQEYVDAGVTHFVMNAGVVPERMMEQYERFAQEVLPLVRGIKPSA